MREPSANLSAAALEALAEAERLIADAEEYRAKGMPNDMYTTWLEAGRSVAECLQAVNGQLVRLGVESARLWRT